MDNNIEDMESQWVQTEESINEHVENVHQWPVIVGGLSSKSPDAFSEHGDDIVKASDPRILYHLGDIIVDEAVPEGTHVKSDSKKRDHEQPQAETPFPQCHASLVFFVSIWHEQCEGLRHAVFRDKPLCHL